MFIVGCRFDQRFPHVNIEGLARQSMAFLRLSMKVFFGLARFHGRYVQTRTKSISALLVPAFSSDNGPFGLRWSVSGAFGLVKGPRQPSEAKSSGRNAPARLVTIRARFVHAPNGHGSKTQLIGRQRQDLSRLTRSDSASPAGGSITPAAVRATRHVPRPCPQWPLAAKKGPAGDSGAKSSYHSQAPNQGRA